MAKPAITLRSATAPSPLTYDQLDQNFENLRDATLSLTAGTGGTQVTVDLNGTITLVAGTNVTLSGDNTAKTITINASGGTGSPAGSNQQIQFNNSGSFGASSGLVYDGTSIKVNGNLESVYQNGDEGGEIYLNKPVTNTSITNGVTIDVFQNRLRIFENGGTNRGGYFTITSLPAGVAKDLGSSLTIDPSSGDYELAADIDLNGYVIRSNGTNIQMGDDAQFGNGSGPMSSGELRVRGTGSINIETATLKFTSATTGTPSNTTTPTTYLQVSVNGNTRYIPLYT